MTLTQLVLLFLSGISVAAGQQPCQGITFDTPEPGTTHEVNTPTECDPIFTLDATSAAGRSFTYTLITSEPTTSHITIEDDELLKCDAANIASGDFTVTIEASDTVSTCQVVFTVRVALAAPLDITLPRTTLDIAKDLFETVDAADIPADVNFEFTVSDSSAVVDVFRSPSSTDVPFEAKLKPTTSDTYFLDLVRTASTSDTPMTIVIKATKGTAEVEKDVTVKLLLRPVFQAPYDQTHTENVNENIGSSADILTLSATDPDGDDTQLMFNVISTVPPSNEPLFTTAGSILQTVSTDVTSSFDVESTGAPISFTLNVTVTDGLLSAETTIIINVVDINDKTPVFTPTLDLQQEVLETVSAGTVILNATATDDDYSSPNNEFQFSLTGDDADHFEINTEGVVTVASPSQLNYTARPSYALVLTVTDKGTAIQLSSTVNLEVNLETAPSFTAPADMIFSEDINEDTGPDSAIFTFTATDEDSAPTALAFNIVDVDPSSGTSLFTMDGAILKTSASVTNTTFDLEATGAIQSYILDMRVTDGKYEATTQFTVRIQDVNDKTPAFTQNSYSLSIPESQIVDIDILTVTATDDDISSPNNEFTFSLSGDDSDHFAINETGSISVSSPSKLNFTSKPSYSLTLTVTDKVTTTQLSSATTLTVTLETAPGFIAPADLITSEDINEDTGPDYAIFTFTATDEDSAPTALAYNIVNVDPSSGTSLFTMDGAILRTSASVTNTTFDLEASGAIQSYILDMRVTDGKYEATTSLTVRVQDVNDKAPSFTEASYSLTIPEFQGADIDILTVTATDDDVSSPNNEFTFSLNGDDSDHFAINETGSISVSSPSKLNFTSKLSYSLTITVIDKATTTTLSSSVTLSVTLETAPRFIIPADLLTVDSINEDTGPDTAIFTCTVTDEDTDPTSLTFSVDSVAPTAGTSLFRMDGVTLKTSSSVTTSSFDLEGTGAVNSFVVKISVSDGKYSATTQIQVDINDVNDNTPTFGGTITQNINDVLAIGGEIIRITATDADFTNAFSDVTYTLIEDIIGNQDYTTFGIDSSTGALTLAKELKKGKYTFTVTATDIGNNMGSTAVTINVMDTMDECDSSPCTNDGSCIHHINYFYCECAEGWEGRMCNTNKDDCNPNPCANNGDCTDGTATYTCNCSNGWTGTNCIQACSGNTYGRNCVQTCQCNDTRLAANTATQKCDVATGACKCNAQWTGDNCETDVDECTQDTTLCSDQANTLCVNNEGGYACLCEQGFARDSLQVCTAVAEDTTITVNSGEVAVIASLTQSLANCVLTPQTLYDLRKQDIETAEKVRIRSALRVYAFGLRCGSISYNLTIVLNDTDEARTSLAHELNDVSNGKPLVIDGQSTVATSLIVTGKQVAINSTIDVAAQVCSIYTAYKPCGSSYECKINAGTPYCEEKDSDDISLILGLALGLSLGLIAIVCAVFLLCYCRMMSKTRHSNSSRSSRRHESVKREMRSSTFAPTYDNPKVSPYLSFAPSIDYNYRGVLPEMSRNSLSSNKDWVFYSPASRNSAYDYKMSRRF